MIDLQSDFTLPFQCKTATYIRDQSLIIQGEGAEDIWGDHNATYLEVGGTKNKEHLKEGV